MKKLTSLFLLAAFLLPMLARGEWYDDSYGTMDARKKNMHSGNMVRTVFYNTGEIGRYQNVDAFSFEWPRGTGDNYVGDVSILVGVEYFNVLTGEAYRSVAHSRSPRGRYDVNPQNVSEYWTFSPLDGFASNDTNLIAMSHQPNSWPSVWPDKGWPGSWNGYFGRDVLNADQESYFWMDDNLDMEFMQTDDAKPDNVDRCFWRDNFPPIVASVPDDRCLFRPVFSVYANTTTGRLAFRIVDHDGVEHMSLNQVEAGDYSGYLELLPGTYRLQAGPAVASPNYRDVYEFQAPAAGSRVTGVFRGSVNDITESSPVVNLELLSYTDEPASAPRQLRFLHMANEVGPLTVQVDGQTVAELIEYGGMSDYIALPATSNADGEHHISFLTEAGGLYRYYSTCLPEENSTFTLGIFSLFASADRNLRLIGEDPEDHVSQAVRQIQPFADDTLRGGLGLKVSVRGMQWAHSLAEDVIFWLYDITNTSDINYDKVVFGMVCGTLVGGDGDSDDDVNHFLLDEEFCYTEDSDDVPGSNTWVPVHPGVVNVGRVGYAFLESPGNSVDWIDNDGDSESDSTATPHLTEDVLEEMLSSRQLFAGDEVVVIDYEHESGMYPRYVTEVPAQDTLVLYWRNERLKLYDGATVAEIPGNLLDDNFNGLIDENPAFVGAAYFDYSELGFSANGDAWVEVPLSVLQAYDPLIDERRDDGIDNDGDWDPEYDDVGGDGQPATGDTGEGDGLPSPGEPHFDALDITESDQIGLTSFDEFVFSEFSPSDDPDTWNRMIPGDFDSTGTPDDVDFIYGTGYFPLRAGETQRISLAVVFGETEDDILENLSTVQTIYDENYNFIQPPAKPILTAVPGDGQVTLYWDDRAEFSVDRVSHLRDFQGYRIYRATDSGFLDNYVITDGQGTQTGFLPMEQFDLIDEVEGYFPIAYRGNQYYLGDNTGLVHSWVDTTAVNGRSYFYAVTSYDGGDVEAGFLPAECAKQASLDAGGLVTLDVNTAYVTPSEPVSGYVPPLVLEEAEHLAGDATGSIHPSVMDETALIDGASYTINIIPDTLGRIEDVLGWEYTEFSPDTYWTWRSSDSTWVAHYIEVPYDSVHVLLDEVTVPAVAWTMTREDLPPAQEVYPINTDTPQQSLAHAGVQIEGFNAHLLSYDVDLAIHTRLDTGAILDSTGVIDVDFDAGLIVFRDAFLDTLDTDALYEVSFTYNYNLVHKQLCLDLTGYQTTHSNYFPVVEGVKIELENDWRVSLDPERSGWSEPVVDEEEVLPWSMGAINIEDPDAWIPVSGEAIPRDYRVYIVDEGVENLDPADFPYPAMMYPSVHADLLPVYQSPYQVYRLEDEEEIPIPFWIYNPSYTADTLQRSHDLDTVPIHHGDNLLLFEPVEDESTLTWSIGSVTSTPSLYSLPATGNIFTGRTLRPFSEEDVFAFEVQGADWNPSTSAQELSDIRVVPNPYIASAVWEPAPISGNRGERRIQFIHLPPRSTVRIYTVRGELVQTLYHNAEVWDGSLNWNLKSKEGLDVATGMYFYHVDSPAGEHRGKFALVK